MRTLRLPVLFSLVALALASTSPAQVRYNATNTASGALTTQTGVKSFLQPLTLSGTDGINSISGLTIGVNYNSLTQGTQNVLIAFYTGLNLSSSASDALSGATYFGSATISLTTPAATGSYAFPVTLSSPITIPTNTFGMVFSFVNAADGTYSSAINPLFRVGAAPTLGVNPSFVYNDANLDGAYSGSEQTRFGDPTSANYYLSVTAAQIPEPSTIAFLLFGGMSFVLGAFASNQTVRPALPAAARS